MKNKILKITFLFLITMAFGIKAQSFQQGQKDINLGLGLGNTFVGSGYTSTFPPISVAIEYGVTDAISVGGFLAFTGAKSTYNYQDWYNGNYYNYTDTYSWTYYIIGVRGAYHFAQFISNDKVDLYAGLMLGDEMVTNTYSTTDPNSSHVVNSSQSAGGFIWSGFVGGRYRFNDHIGIFGELGYGISNLNIGLNLKF